MAKKFPSRSIVEDDCIIENKELNVALEDLEKVENEKESLKENLKVENDCIKNLRDQIKKFKERYIEVSD